MSWQELGQPPQVYSGLPVSVFPMSGNNTLETSDFADPASLFEAVRVRRSLPQCPYGKHYCETNYFVFSLSKEFFFSAFWLKKNQRLNSQEKKLPRCIKIRLVFSRLFYIRGNLGNVLTEEIRLF